MVRHDYFRRCHVCGEVSQGNEQGEIHKCSHCGKAWAPFHFFDDKKSPTYGDRAMRPESVEGKWRPLHGLTVYWDEN